MGGRHKKRKKKDPTHFLLQLKNKPNDPGSGEQNLGPEPKNIKQHFYLAIEKKQIRSQKTVTGFFLNTEAHLVLKAESSSYFCVSKPP